MKRLVIASVLCLVAIPAFAAAPPPAAPAQDQPVTCPRSALIDAMNMINEPSKYRDGVLSVGMELLHCLQPAAPMKAADKPAEAPHAGK